MCINPIKLRPQTRWLFFFSPLLLLVPLFWFPISFGAVVYWIIGFVIFYVSIISLFFQLVQILYRIIKGKEQVYSYKIRLIRPIMAIVIFWAALYSVKLSRIAADQYAVQVAIKVQRDIQSTNLCPPFIEGWTDNKIRYGRFGTKYLIIYLPNESNEFEIRVRHNIDEFLYIKGGIGKQLQVFTSVSGQEKAKEIIAY